MTELSQVRVTAKERHCSLCQRADDYSHVLTGAPFPRLTEGRSVHTVNL